MQPLKAIDSNFNIANIPGNTVSGGNNLSSIVKLQALARGSALRKTVATPNQLRPLIGNQLPPQESEEISKTLSKLLVQTQRDPSLRTVGHKITGCSNADLDVEIGNSTIELLLVPKEDAIGLGSFKEVFAATKIDLNLPNKASSRFEVVMRSQGDTPERLERSLKFILSGIEIQRRLKELCPDAKIMDVPKRLLPKSPSEISHQFSQVWVNVDLDIAVRRGQVPLRPGLSSPTVPFSLESLVKVLIDISETLEKLHEKKVVHRDVKPENILVLLNDPQENKENENPTDFKREFENFDGRLSDFDLAHNIGFSTYQREYFVWDSCAKKGWVTPFCDVYGLAMTMAMTMFNFTCEITDWRIALLDTPVQSATLNQILKEHIETFIKQNPELLPFHCNFEFSDHIEYQTLLELNRLIHEQKAFSNFSIVEKLAQLKRHHHALSSAFDTLVFAFETDKKLLEAFNSSKKFDMFDGKGQHTLAQLFCSSDDEMKERAGDIITGIIERTSDFTDRLKFVQRELIGSHKF